MITDKEMTDLGFVKQKTYKKKKVGVSKYCWLKNNCFMLTIEKNLGADFGDEHFLPTFRNFNYVWFMEDISEVKELLKLLNLLD